MEGVRLVMGGSSVIPVSSRDPDHHHPHFSPCVYVCVEVESVSMWVSASVATAEDVSEPWWVRGWTKEANISLKNFHFSFPLFQTLPKLPRTISSCVVPRVCPVSPSRLTFRKPACQITLPIVMIVSHGYNFRRFVLAGSSPLLLTLA